MQTALPESVRKAAELSNQLQAKMKAGTLTFEDTQVTADQVQMPPPQQQMPKGFQPQAAGAGAPGLGTPGFNPQPAEAPGTPPAAAAPAQQPAAAPPPDDAAAEHRYKVLQGKYNAEVPRLQKTTQEQQRELEMLRNQLNSTQAILATLGAQPPQVARPPAHAPLVTDKDTTEYGPDLVDLMRRVAQETVAPRISSLEERFQPIAQTVQQMAPVVQQTAENQGRTQAELAHEKMCNGLDQAVPTWETVNQSPEFIAWLDQVDPLSGAKRGAMLTQAYGSGDVTRVANFFTGFMNEHAAVAPRAQQAQGTPPGTPPAGKPLVNLASLAAPGTGVGGPAAAGTPNEPGQPRGFTAAEVGAFYKDVQKGLFKGRDAEKIQIERAIFAAQKAGQIRP